MRGPDDEEVGITSVEPLGDMDSSLPLESQCLENLAISSDSRDDREGDLSQPPTSTGLY